MPHAQLAQRLRSADIFILPSLEEGLARTSLEALACGLPIVVTPHTGSNDFVRPGVNGEIVPIRNARAIADAVLKWRDRLFSNFLPQRPFVDLSRFSFDYFERSFVRQLQAIGLA
jgi:glycosyltransferase involved in cell wall biosynthesis